MNNNQNQDYSYLMIYQFKLDFINSDLGMQRSQKIRLLSSKKMDIQKNLPSLKSSVLMNKAIIAISKVDINGRPMQKEINLKTTHNNQSIDHHQRSQSGFSLRKNKQMQTTMDIKSQTKMPFDLPSNSFKIQLKNIRQQIESQNTIQPFIIDKSKISSKAYGIIKGYSANSHPGPILSYNEDRICIITNLTKTSIKQKQISFFGVYDGNQGTLKADYFRDNFHLLLMQDQNFPKDMQISMKRCLRKIVNLFSEDSKFAGDESNLSFVMVIVLNEDIYCMQSGYCKFLISQKLGQIMQSTTKNQANIMKQTGKKSKSTVELIKKQNKNQRQMLQVEFRHLKAYNNLDFILLGSEGVFQNIKMKDIGKKLWLYLLRNRYESIHFGLGQANNLLLNDVFANLGTKNASIIIIGFSNIASCLQTIQDEEKIELPYVKNKVSSDS